ncbi:DUF2326 domain-containing protein [Bacillus massilinigeriensis]|uniref:DUF2326 domain-containing protein n=1 Tax=Bacillus mediterraneensis TaxID=1805474 RepID=UPI0008F942F1|nr:DUF2326 domain-containing protein [Bacillus mediterraneensis]
MLKEIRCEIFKEKVIEFHNGLNVVLGDNLGSNSIGKSTLLMILDFVYGGNTYITHNKDVVSKLGHHEFLYILEFLKVKLYFIRGTEEPNIIYKCNSEFEKEEEIKLSDFNNLLKEYYKLQSDSLKFRSAVSLFSRVWGKNNYDVKRPLHSHHSEKNIETITRLIKLFNEYDKLAKEDKEIKQLTESKNVLNKAGRLKFIPKITKKVYESNLKEIENLKGEIEKLSKSAFSPVINISEIISDELIELRERKNILIEERDYYKSRFNRTSKKITKYTDVGFEKLLEFFPDVNIEKLESIEDFHEGISSILKKELKRAKQELKRKIESLNKEIDEINKKLEQVLNPNEEQNVFIDSLIESSSRLKSLQLENDYFNKLQSVTDGIASKTTSLSQLKESIVKKIKLKINSKLVEINDSIHNDKRTPPELDLTYNNYEYKYLENTGTGKAFTNLIIFDLAIFTLTELPFIIHDSFLFKNIEKAAVENLISYYNELNKQAFIAIDVIDIYSEDTQKILKEKKVIQLSKDKLLFILDWRDNPIENE